jgi:hypothetical protein
MVCDSKKCLPEQKNIFGAKCHLFWGKSIPARLSGWVVPDCSTAPAREMGPHVWLWGIISAGGTAKSEVMDMIREELQCWIFRMHLDKADFVTEIPRGGLKMV